MKYHIHLVLSLAWLLLLLSQGQAQCNPKTNDTCVIYPWTPTCVDYNLPTSSVVEDVNSLCQGSMVNMPSCAVNTICQNSSFAGSKYCQSFSILKEGCIDMSGMSGCRDYKCMCSNNTVVEECNTDILPLPTSSEALELISAICTEMPMEDCARCPTPISIATCELLPVYSDLCNSMPEMDQCSVWIDICNLVPTWPICPKGGIIRPIMKMYFHWGIYNYVLFKQWLPATTVAFIGTWIVVCAMSILYELLRVLRSRCEVNWQYKNADTINENEESDQKELNPSKPIHRTPPFRIAVDVPRAILHTLEVALGFMLMLVAMTFNVALFMAICLGAFVGSLCCHRFATTITDASHH